MRNEEAIRYTTETMAPSTTGTMITDARIRLAGREEPSIQISNRRELETYCHNLIGYSAIEEMHVICVDCQCRIIAESMISTGTLSQCDAYMSKIAQVALLSNAHSIFLTHNHPGGTCAPSGEDLTATAQIQKMLKMFGIKLLDHMIITTNNGGYSMGQHGDMQY